MVHYEVGNLLDAPVDYICHQVNCQGRMGSGIAKSIRDKWPAVYDVYKRDLEIGKGLGDISIACVQGNTPIQYIVNMFGQANYGYDGKRYTSYDAFWSCLNKIKETVPEGSEIAFPDHIGCGLGGANWSVIQSMIYAALNEDYSVYIYRLED